MCDETYKIEKITPELKIDNLVRLISKEALNTPHFVYALNLELNEGKLRLCENCSKITIHRDGRLEFHFCESDPFVWTYDEGTDIMVVQSELPFYYRDKYGLGTDDFKEFCELLGIDVEISEEYVPY